jgi:hypothetical protein
MQGPQQSENLLSSPRLVKRVEVLPERTYPAYTVTRQTFYGQCLACGHETEYGDGWWTGTNEEDKRRWYLEQLEPSRRKVHMRVLEGTRGQGRLSISTLEGLICEPCRRSYKEVRDPNEKARRAKKWAKEDAEQRSYEDGEEQGRRDQERWTYHTTWRDASRGEFDKLPAGLATFTATVRKGRSHKILFRWRPVGGKCRGDSPRNVVRMWVDGASVSHYHGWNFAPLAETSPFFGGGEKDEAIWERRDVFGVGFCAWFDRDFQEELLRVKPAAIWRASGGAWPLNRDLSDLKTPCVVHTECPDGKVYARVLADDELPKVREFAKERLGVRIGQPGRPVR